MSEKGKSSAVGMNALQTNRPNRAASFHEPSSKRKQFFNTSIRKHNTNPSFSPKQKTIDASSPIDDYLVPINLEEEEQRYLKKLKFLRDRAIISDEEYKQKIKNFVVKGNLRIDVGITQRVPKSVQTEQLRQQEIESKKTVKIRKLSKLVHSPRKASSVSPRDDSTNENSSTEQKITNTESQQLNVQKIVGPQIIVQKNDEEICKLKKLLAEKERELQSIIDVHKQQIEKLNQQMNTLKAQVDQLTTKNEQLASELQFAKDQLLDVYIKSEISATDEMKKEYDAKLEQLRKEHEAEIENVKLKFEHEKLEYLKQLQKYRQIHHDLLQDKNKLYREIEQAKLHEQSMQKEIQYNKMMVRALKEQIEKAKSNSDVIAKHKSSPPISQTTTTKKSFFQRFKLLAKRKSSVNSIKDGSSKTEKKVNNSFHRKKSADKLKAGLYDLALSGSDNTLKAAKLLGLSNIPKTTKEEELNNTAKAAKVLGLANTIPQPPKEKQKGKKLWRMVKRNMMGPETLENSEDSYMNYF